MNCGPLEMTIVTRPFVLDFAGAYIGEPPEFTDEAWSQWEVDKQEQFGDNWPEAKQVLRKLKHWDIYMIDVTPSNIAFA